MAVTSIAVKAMAPVGVVATIGNQSKAIYGDGSRSDGKKKKKKEK